MPVLTADELRAAVSYDPETGVFTWRNPASRRVRSGSPAGSVTGYGYLSIRINKRAYLAHRLAWLYVHGNWPASEIDHVNGIRTDNRIVNLRDVPGNVNRQNVRRPKRTCKSGVLGVVWSERYQKWEAKLTVNHKNRYIGRFDDKQEAHAAYLQAKREFHEGCTL